jgi:hypothetical protein
VVWGIRSDLEDKYVPDDLVVGQQTLLL